MEHTSSVRRPESGTWGEFWRLGTAAMGGVQGPLRGLWGPGRA
ncbi:unnamed protein product [Staurois parvus]|uniref:Uncharacterized protein n=1 Tax=Staurois parvus TaxID=386267 RepID=A0ABN9DBY1_9NEOB|nr:unnamed protein product [Staurois parvus]